MVQVVEKLSSVEITGSEISVLEIRTLKQASVIMALTCGKSALQRNMLLFLHYMSHCRPHRVHSTASNKV